MSTLTIDRNAADIELPATGGKAVKLSDYRGQNLVLFFYPKANTPGCTRESNDFSAANNQFQRCNTVVLGISRDGLKAQEGFKRKQGFVFDLLSDPDERLCQAFDVMRTKNLYGKQVRGIERSTFLLDTTGQLRREWRKVQVEGHVAEVLAAAQALNKA